MLDGYIQFSYFTQFYFLHDWLRGCLHMYFHTGLSFNTEVKSHPTLFSRPSFRPNWNFTPGIFFVWSQCLNQFLFDSGLKSDFFVQSEVIWKPHHSEFYSFVSYKIIKQIAYKNVKWMKDGWIRTPKVESITRKKKHVNTGYWRIKTKVKQVRQDYRKSIGKRQRSRSGKLVCDS